MRSIRRHPGAAVAGVAMVLAGAGAAAGADVPDGFELERVAGALEFPTALAFAPPPDGRILFAERTTGRVRVLEDGALRPEPYLEIPDVGTGIRHGILGLALDPAFAETGHVYFFYTQAAPLRHRVVRYTEGPGGVAGDPVVLLDDIPAATYHNGGPIAFAPDGTLFIQTGDNGLAEDPERAQDPASLAGKILRIAPDGSIPPDNPFVGVPGVRPEIWSLGHRNGFGVAPDRLRPVPLRAYVSENGPAIHDEINLAVAGGNYGWPRLHGVAAQAGFVDPIHAWLFPTVAPTGIEQYTADAYPAAYRGDLFVGYYIFQGGGAFLSTVARVRLDATGERALGVEPFVSARLPGDLATNFVLDVEQGPDGLLYFTTGNALWRVALSPPGVLRAAVRGARAYRVGDAVAGLQLKSKGL